MRNPTVKIIVQVGEGEYGATKLAEVEHRQLVHSATAADGDEPATHGSVIAACDTLEEVLEALLDDVRKAALAQLAQARSVATERVELREVGRVAAQP